MAQADANDLVDPIKLSRILGVTHIWTGRRAEPLPGEISEGRASLHFHFEWVPDEESAWNLLAQRWATIPRGLPDPGPPVIAPWLPTTGTRLPEAVVGSASVRVTIETPGRDASRVVVKIDPPSTGILVLRDSLLPGWHAWADGRQVEIYGANIAHRAVYLEQPTARVEWLYRAPGALVGSWISGCALVVWLGLMVSWSPALFRRRDPFPLAAEKGT
jgi:hypothetical protein